MVMDSALAIGLDLPSESGDTYQQMLRVRWTEFAVVNQKRDPKKTAQFWRQLTEDWLQSLGLSIEIADSLSDKADELCFGPNSSYFRIFPDVIDGLEQLKMQGIRVAVISNWDTSLHRVLQCCGLAEKFELVLASLEEGVEKPDPGLFRIALGAMAVRPDEVLHVGDNPVDDLQGAWAAGMSALLIDRSQPPDFPRRISSLTQILEAIAWTA